MDGPQRLSPHVARAEIVDAARAWLDTPYRHQASEQGAGADCLGLIRGVWRALYGDEPEAVPAYSPDWAELAGEETLRDAGRRHLLEIPLSTARAGDVLLFRVRAGTPAKHAAILTAPTRIIHAYWGRAVTETSLTPWWLRRRAYAFSFPGAID